jgi:3-oxoacyl-[acyl-carrier protein] reductase
MPRYFAYAYELIPLGRIGQPEDIAPMVLFLASNQARFIKGQVLYD